MSRVKALVVVGLLLGTFGSVPVAAAEDPRINASVPEPQLQPGQEQRITVQLTNDAEDVEDQVTTAHQATVKPLDGSTPFDVLSGPQSIGALADGEPTPVSFRLAVPANATAGTYEIPLAITYEYDGDERERTTVAAQVRVPTRPRFEVRSVSSNLVPKETGPIRLELENVGAEPARDASFTLRSKTQELRLGGARSTTVHGGDVAVGEKTNITVLARTTDRTVPPSLAISITPTTENENGITVSQSPTSVSVSPGRPQTFAYRNVSVSLHGSRARVTGTVVNTGPAPVSETSVIAQAPAGQAHIIAGTSPVGRLRTGESAPFAVSLRVDPNAHPGPKDLRMAVQYERDSHRTYRSDGTMLRIPLRTNTSVLQVEPVNTTLEIDTSNTLRVRVRNAGSQTLHDVRATVGVRAPFESNTPTAGVRTLAPGETSVLTFEVTTPEDGVPTTDVLPLNVSATSPADQRLRFGQHYVPITMTNPGGGMSEAPVGAFGALVVIVLVVGGWWWYNR